MIICPAEVVLLRPATHCPSPTPAHALMQDSWMAFDNLLPSKSFFSPSSSSRLRETYDVAPARRSSSCPRSESMSVDMPMSRRSAVRPARPAGDGSGSVRAAASCESMRWRGGAACAATLRGGGGSGRDGWAAEPLPPIPRCGRDRSRAWAPKAVEWSNRAVRIF